MSVQSLWTPEEGVRSSGTGITDGCKLPHEYCQPGTSQRAVIALPPHLTIITMWIWKIRRQHLTRAKKNYKNTKNYEKSRVKMELKHFQLELNLHFLQDPTSV